jgi:hypothetical protein
MPLPGDNIAQQPGNHHRDDGSCLPAGLANASDPARLAGGHRPGQGHPYGNLELREVAEQFINQVLAAPQLTILVAIPGSRPAERNVSERPLRPDGTAMRMIALSRDLSVHAILVDARARLSR